MGKDEGCEMTGNVVLNDLDIPTKILDAADEVELYMKAHHHGPWALGGIQSRDFGESQPDGPSAPVGVVLSAKEREWLEYAVDQMAASFGPEDAICYEVLHGLMTRVDALAQQPAASAEVPEGMMMVQVHDASILSDFARENGGPMEQLAARRIAALAAANQRKVSE